MTESNSNELDLAAILTDATMLARTLGRPVAICQSKGSLIAIDSQAIDGGDVVVAMVGCNGYVARV